MGQSNFQFHKRFINLTDVNFTKQEENILNFNLKYNFSHPINKNVKEMLAIEAENIIQTTDISNKNILRAQVIAFLNSNKPNLKSYNYSKNHLKSLNEKIKSNDLIITKADKGSCLVIMKRDKYIGKVMDFLNSEDFESINRDPTNTFFFQGQGDPR